MTRPFLTVAAMALAALLLMACGGTPTATRTPGGPATTVAPATQAGNPPTQAPGQTSGSGQEPHEAPELEQFIPRTVNGQAVRVASLRGANALEGANPALATALERANVPADNLATAVGSPVGSAWFAAALSVQGMDATVLRDAIIGSTGTPTQQTISGKNVSVLLDSQYFYVTGNVLLTLISADAAVTNDFFAQVP